MSSLNFPLCNFEPFPQVLSLNTGEKRSAPPSQLTLLQEAVENNEVPTSWQLQCSLHFTSMKLPPSLQIDQHQLLRQSSEDICFSSFTRSVFLLWVHSSALTAFLNFEDPELYAVLRMRSHPH